MAKKPTVTTISSGYASNTQLNNNFTALRNAFDNTLSRDGSTPNYMEADLDLNSNDLLNAKEVRTEYLYINGQLVSTGGVSSAGPADVTVDRFTGDGTTTSFTLTRAPLGKSATFVFVDGVSQEENTYSLSSTSLLFTEAPPLYSHIEVRAFSSQELDLSDSSSLYRDLLSGDGSTTEFTLDATPVGQNNSFVFISGVYQQKTTYTLVGNTLTFSSAPPSGTNNIEVMSIATTPLGSTTSDLVTYNQGSVGSVSRTVENKLQETVSVKDFGAVCDGVTNDATALINALNTGLEVIIPETSYISFSAGQVQTFVENLNLVSPKQLNEFLLPDGDHSITQQVELTNPDARNITIKGSVKTQVSCTAIANVGGSAKNYSIRYTLSDASDVAVGDYIYVGYTAGTGNYNVAEGVWKVTAKTGNDVTVKHTLNATWPTITVTDARVIPLKTILRWPTTQRGLAISGCQLRGIENLVIASQFDISSGTPTDSYSDGLQVGTAPDQLNTGDFESQQTNAGAVWLKNVGVVEWEGNGVQVLGGNAYFFQAAACSNGWRGFQAARNGSIGAKYCAAVGNGSSGFETEAMGFVNANGGVAAGNHEQGCYAIGPSSISFSNGFSLLNATAGIDVRNFGTVLADGAKVDGNQSRGLYSTAGNILFGSSAVSSNNTTYDVQVSEGGTVDANGASGIGTVNIDYDSASKVIGTDGEVIWPSTRIIENSTSQAKISLTSIGDVYFSQDSSGAGFVDTLRIKNTSGTTYPNADNTSELGRGSNRWKVVYAVTGTINTSDQNQKQQIRQLSDAEKAVAVSLKGLVKAYKWNDAVTLKGDAARTHVGLIAQEVEAAFSAQGLDGSAYGVLCRDVWWTNAEGKIVTDDDENPIADPADTTGMTRHERMGLRYDQVFAFIISTL